MGALLFYAGDVLVEQMEMDDAHLALAEKRLAGSESELVRRALCANIAASLAVDGRWRELFGEANLAEVTDQLSIKVRRDANNEGD